MTEPLTDRPLVQVLIASTRSNRAGEPTARWVAAQAAASGAFDIEVVDLAEIDLHTRRTGAPACA